MDDPHRRFEIRTRERSDRSGRAVANLEMTSGQRIRVESDGEAVRLAWTSQQADVDVLRSIGVRTRQQHAVDILQGADLKEPRVRGRALGWRLTRMADVRLVRVDTEGETIVWERPDPRSPAEITVAARTWAAAGEVAAQLGELDIGRHVGDLAAQVDPGD